MPQHVSRPQITVCIDVATRTPIGHHIGFEPPSIHTALLALQGASQHDRSWKGWGCPTQILPDNGATHRSPDLQQAAAACAPHGDARPESDR